MPKTVQLAPLPEQKVVTLTSKGFQIRLHVKPNSKVDRITEVQQDSVHVAVTEAAHEGKANRGVIELLTGVLGFRKSDAVIVAGQKSREKVMLVSFNGFSTNGEDQMKEAARIVENLEQAVRR